MTKKTMTNEWNKIMMMIMNDDNDDSMKENET